jgi:hypothetical protein
MMWNPALIDSPPLQFILVAIVSSKDQSSPIPKEINLQALNVENLQILWAIM